MGLQSNVRSDACVVFRNVFFKNHKYQGKEKLRNPEKRTHRAPLAQVIVTLNKPKVSLGQ